MSLDDAIAEVRAVREYDELLQATEDEKLAAEARCESKLREWLKLVSPIHGRSALETFNLSAAFRSGWIAALNDRETP